MPGNPEYNPADPDSNESRLLAYGLRNPFRFTVAPNGQLWLGDAGWRATEELNVLPTASSDDSQLRLALLRGRRAPGRIRRVRPRPLRGPLRGQRGRHARGCRSRAFTYSHHDVLYPGDPCPEPGGGSATSGITFYTGNSFPAEYQGSLFFTDYARYCIWHVPVDSNGDPIFDDIEVFDILPEFGAAPVDLKVGPDGALYYVDIIRGQLRRIQHTAGNAPPVAVADATPRYGPLPLTVNFDASDSSDADTTDTLTYEWDLDGDGQFDDSTDPAPTRQYTQEETVTVRLRVSDGSPETDTDTIRIDAGNQPPVPQITTPAPGTTWTVGDDLNFHGTAMDPDEGVLDPADIRWDIDLNHCVTGGGCHVHHQITRNGDDDVQIFAPDHYYPAYLTVTMTATDAKGLSVETKLDLMPNTVDVQAQSIPAGLQLQINDDPGAASHPVTTIQGSQIQAIAPTPQTLSASTYSWCKWSDGGARVHLLTANAPLTLTATYAPNCPPTDLDLSSPTVAENLPLGTAVGGLSTTDPERDDSHTYSFAAGTGDADNAAFTIDGSTLRTAAGLDFEARSRYTVRIRTDDGHGGTTAKAFTINVTDADDAPVGPALSNGWVSENLPAGSLVAGIESTDQDGGDTAIYSLADGAGDADNSDFRVDGSNLVTSEPLDFEDDPTRQIRLAVVDAGGSRSERTFAIAVADIVEPIELDVLRTKIPRHASELATVGVRSLLRCSRDCRVRVVLEASGRVARKLGLREKVGATHARLEGGTKEWVTAELDRRSQRLLADYDGRRAPKVEPRFKASKP